MLGTYSKIKYTFVEIDVMNHWVFRGTLINCVTCAFYCHSRSFAFNEAWMDHLLILASVIVYCLCVGKLIFAKKVHTGF